MRFIEVLIFWSIHKTLSSCSHGLWKLIKYIRLLKIPGWDVEIMFINMFINRLIFAKMWGGWNTLVRCMPWKIWVIPPLMIVSVSDMIIICLNIRLCCVYMFLNKFRILICTWHSKIEYLGQLHMWHGSRMQGTCGCSRDRNRSIFLFKVSNWSKKFSTPYIPTLQNHNFSGHNHKQSIFSQN